MIFLPTFGLQTWPFAHFFRAKRQFSLLFWVRILLIFKTKVGKARKSGHKSGQKFSLPSIFSLPFEGVFHRFSLPFVRPYSAVTEYDHRITTQNCPHPARFRRIHRHNPPRSCASAGCPTRYWSGFRRCVLLENRCSRRRKRPQPACEQDISCHLTPLVHNRLACSPSSLTASRFSGYGLFLCY